MVMYMGQNKETRFYDRSQIGQDDGQSEVECLRYSQLPSTRTDLGYNWTEVPLEEVMSHFKAFLERNNAKAHMMDVYASNNQVYRNMVIQLPYMSEVFGSEEDIHIQFNRDKGRQFTLKVERGQ